MSSARPLLPLPGRVISGGNVPVTAIQPQMALKGRFVIGATAGPDPEKTFIV